uniref:Uncharacterized protein n=1 Tax=Anolis carolinensis TaxID=28377 RepID=A0A803SR50_ANOCA
CCHIYWNMSAEFYPGLKSPNVFDSVAKGNLSELEKYLKENEVNAVNSANETLLHIAAAHGHTEIIDYLISKGSKTPLHLGAEKGHIALVELLLGSNADPNSADKEKKTPLHLASIGSHLSTIKALLAKKSRFGAKDMDGCIPAHYAAISGNMEILKALLVAGNYKNINDKNIWRKTPLHLTAEYGHSDMMHYLLSNGSAINALDNNKDTPLHCACKAGHFNCVNTLVNWSAGEKVNLQATNSLKKTPLKSHPLRPLVHFSTGI